MAYANALRHDETTRRVTYGERPRSLDIVAPLDTETTDIIAAITDHPLLKSQTNRILSIFQIGRNTFNMTFDKGPKIEKLKESFLFQAREGIETHHGKAYLQSPRQPTAKIPIRAVPTEVDEENLRNSTAAQ